ncbi:MAG TPA: Fe-S cluster assembly protein SufD [Gammaproteobacteria bacterium]|nr:Fe-S cluster assembly protein SufD [Gammaproteobacteria bacterium]
MNKPAVLTGNFVDEFERVVKTLPGGNELADRRRNAIERFRAQGLPTLRQEAWKYTNVTPLARRAYRAATRKDAGTAAAGLIAKLPDYAAEIRLVFENGQLRADLNDGRASPAGVSLRSLADVLREAPADAARRAPGEATPFQALNDAFCTDGVLITLAPGAHVEPPIHLVFLATGGADALAVHPRVLIRAGAGSRARIVETYRGGTEAGLTNAVTEISAAEGAHIEHYLVQDESAGAFHIGHLHIEQARASEVISHAIAMGGLLARRDIEVRLTAEQAGATLYGLYLTGGRQHVDHHTRVDHLAPHTRSEEFYRGILNGSSRAVFNGRVIVHPGAFKTDARQSNHNLLLSKDAEVDTKPELEIYADDVKCSHGATVGRLDADALFYLRSRGLDEVAARGLLTYAFAADVISRIGIESLRRELARRVAGQLPGGELVKDML